MLVVRIERRGRGMFRPANKNIRRLRIMLDIYDQHANGFPTPYLDGGLDMDLDDKEWFCSYKSIETMFEYLTHKQIRFLISKGFKVLLLEVTNYQEGDFQVIYTKDSVVNTTDLTELFNR